MIVIKKKGLCMKINSVNGTTYDGVFFFPAVNEEGDDVMAFNFWSFNGKYANKKSIEDTEVGNKFFVVFFKQDEEDGFVIDDTFEAIFADPKVYLEGLVGSNLFGVLCRKTSNSHTWLKKYVKETMEKLKVVSEKD